MPNNFQGKEVELKLKVFSSFTTDMITDSVYTIPRDSRFSFKHAVYDGRTVVMSGEKSFVGRVTFDPGAICRLDDSCYSGFSLTSPCKSDRFRVRHFVNIPRSRFNAY